LYSLFSSLSLSLPPIKTSLHHFVRVNPAALFLQPIHFFVTHAPTFSNIYKSSITAADQLVLIRPTAPRRDQNISVHLLQVSRGELYLLNPWITNPEGISRSRVSHTVVSISKFWRSPFCHRYSASIRRFGTISERNQMDGKRSPNQINLKKLM
jgi:hypothetical protein